MTNKEKILIGIAKEFGFTSFIDQDGSIKIIPVQDESTKTKAVGFSAKAIEILNKRLKTKYRHTTVMTARLLSTLRHDGYSLEDIEKVVHAQANLWENDPKMSQWLTPKTLFAASNFEKYLMNASKVVESKMYRVLTKEDWS